MANRQAASLEELMASSRLYRMHPLVRLLPAPPRCKICNVPFAGAGQDLQARRAGPVVQEPEHVHLLLGSSEPPLPVGAGADFGRALVGNVGEEDVKDFTALGDVVNTAARLQAAAQPGQLVVSERVYEVLQERFEHAVPVDLELKGKAAPVPAWIIAARSMKETAGTAV